MTLYKHRNKKCGIIAITDSKGKVHVLKPGEEVSIDRKRPGNGVVCEETVEEKKITKKFMEED